MAARRWHLLVVVLAACALTSRSLSPDPSAHVTPDQKVAHAVSEARATLVKNREEDQKAFAPVQTVCETYTTPEARRVAELSKQIEAEQDQMKDIQKKEDASTVPLTLEQEVESTEALIKEQEAYLAPIEELKTMVAPLHTKWISLMEDTVETVASDDEGSSEGEGSSEVATLLELQSSGRALRHEGRRSLQGGRGAAAAMEVTSGDSLAIAMQALVDAVEAVKKDSEDKHSEISDAVDKASAEHQVTLAALKLKLGQLTGMEDGLLDKGLKAKAGEKEAATEVEQLQEALETAKAAAATSFNMCTSYLNEFDERELQRKTVEGLLEEMAKRGETARKVFEGLLNKTCCPCGEVCDDGSEECQYCAAAAEAEAEAEANAAGTQASATAMQFAGLSMVSDDEANAVQAQMEALLEGN